MIAARMAALVAAAALILLAASGARAQQSPEPDSASSATAADATAASATGQAADGGARQAPAGAGSTERQLPGEPGAAGGADAGSEAAGAADTLSAAAGVAPDTVTVGDHFRVLVRVRAPAGATVVFPPFNLIEPVESVDSVRVRRDSLGAWTATYSLTAWITSDSLVAAIPFRVRSADGSSRDLRVRVELPHVRSVLPADSALHVPKPAKAVLPIVVAAPTPRGWLLPAVLLGLVFLAIVWLAVRRRRLTIPTLGDARAAALAKLREIEGAGLLARGEVHEYHVRTSRVLREYLAAAAALGEDLTSSELLRAMRLRSADPATVAELERLLREADRVKFAGPGAGRGAVGGRTHGEGVSAWISAWPPPEAATDASPPTAEAA